ncbi:hypothetical protein [Methanobacterium paludis]|uniref:Uncharacterized protein n=1 Tax=Methanobacterium paludis (strain DSM 25820 / JCM 18151 / SWAN1) TaxID=868131 RepID=F6D3S8_METPW|nr:hypothetical protein [Methanobacterium paludis]AEG18072.1 hypothetical protein MSWAN_1051 [Methanobacterium paludis]
MDDKGFIFTADATLALVVVIVITASIVTYVGLPIFQGEDHQHLEALADSVLESMDQSGTLARDAALCSSNNTTLQDEGRSDLIENLNLVIPQGIGYKLTVGNSVISSTDSDASVNHTSPATSSDVATKVKVISGAQIGWVGRAYYKQEEVNFVDQNQTQVTTLWNFHNWLQNFNPWSNGLDNDPYWAGGQSPGSISFNIPTNGTINGAKFLLGSSGGYYNQSWWQSWWVDHAYNANFVLNGNSHSFSGDDFTDLQYSSPNTGEMYNYLGNISGSELNSGLNNFYVNFIAQSSRSEQYMPWFSVIGNYSTSIKVPQGVLTNTFNFTDIAGVGNPSKCLQYDLTTGSIITTPTKSISWNDLKQTTQNPEIDTSTPFQLTNIPSGTSQGSAVASTCDVYLPDNTRLFDAYTVVNPYGGCDRAIVQVKNSYGTWQTIFTSFDYNGVDYTERTDGGYGNIPGILNIAPYLTAGHNTVRIILWDDAPGSDYDLVGLTSCYSTITYSQLPIRWDTFAFNSKQYKSSTGTQSQNFNIASDAQEALLFLGTGMDSRNITVTVKKQGSSTTSTLYTGSIPYVLNLGDLDAASTQTKHIITNVSTNGSYQLVPGNYTLTVSLTPGKSYESGDYGGSGTSVSTYANPEIFSGTRIGIIYPKFLQNAWSSGFASTADEAKTNANNTLQGILNSTHVSYNANLIKTEAIFTGDTPSSIPVRLELWKQ